MLDTLIKICYTIIVVRYSCNWLPNTIEVWIYKDTQLSWLEHPAYYSNLNNQIRGVSTRNNSHDQWDELRGICYDNPKPRQRYTSVRCRGYLGGTVRLITRFSVPPPKFLRKYGEKIVQTNIRKMYYVDMEKDRRLQL